MARSDPMLYDPHPPQNRPATFATWELDPRAERVRYPAWWKATLGYAAEAGPDSTRTWRDRVHPDDLPSMLGALHAHLGGWTSRYDHQFRLRDAAGHFRPVRSSGQVVLRDRSGRPLRMAGTMKSLVEAVAPSPVADTGEPEHRVLLDSDLVGLLSEQDGRIAWINRAAVELLRHPPAALVGTPTEQLFPDRAACAAFTAQCDLALRLGRSARLQAELCRADGTAVWVDVACARHPQRPAARVWRLIDISDAHALQARFAHQALHDPLTGLPNRRLLTDRMTTALAGRERDGSLLALCYIDLDGFKQVNDVLGHDAGDRLLRRAAGAMGRCIRPHDTLARVGGDEFVLLLTALPSRALVQPLLARLLRAVEACPQDAGGPLRLSASIGVALCPDDGDATDALLGLADRRMFIAKRRGGGDLEIGRP